MSHSFTFIQGSTFKQLRESLLASDNVQQTLEYKSDADVLAFFDATGQYSHPEGLFFPETYAFDPGASDEDIMRRAYEMMQSKLAALWAKRDLEIAISTPYEALILASIIEKETGLASERKKISGVFMNRLRKGMKLQTDPTVIYGLGDSYNGNITRKHLTTDTPYNTYTRRGLPPSPISFPGYAAIEAALHPDQTEAIFFVAKGDGSGGHNFSKTLSEHNRAVKQYLKNRKKSG
ncbi:MAG: endolytic transglycosylase MltG [Gammaproteobacteria bacterium]|nr:endolytic transglycosylase MltG [Gammaproteobacteria bacterium]